MNETASQKIMEKIVFSISQLDGSQALAMLSKIARSHREPEIRKKAIFWLGQRDETEAAKVLEEIVNE